MVFNLYLSNEWNISFQPCSLTLPLLFHILDGHCWTDPVRVGPSTCLKRSSIKSVTLFRWMRIRNRLDKFIKKIIRTDIKLGVDWTCIAVGESACSSSGSYSSGLSGQRAKLSFASLTPHPVQDGKTYNQLRIKDVLLISNRKPVAFPIKMFMIFLRPPFMVGGLENYSWTCKWIVCDIRALCHLDNILVLPSGNLRKKTKIC